MVTGASSGFGAEVSRRLSAQGDTVILADIADEAGRALAEELGQHYVHCDVSDPESNDAAVAFAEQTAGRLDVAILNAGVIGNIMGVDDFTLARYRTVLGVNFDSVAFGIQAAVPALRRSGGGSIVATASLAGLVPMVLDPIYTATKHAVVAYCRALAPALLAEQIRLNIACPGFAETPLIEGFVETFAAASFPLLDPAEVADVIIALTEHPGAGEAWFIQPGRKPAPFKFATAPGPRHPDGSSIGLPPDLAP